MKNDLTYSHLPKAGFIIRLLAFLADCLILALPPLLYLYFSNLEAGDLLSLTVAFGWYLILFVILGNLFLILYSSLTMTFLGGTLGMLVAGLRVIDEKGKNLSFGMSLFRVVIGYPLSSVLLGLGFLWIIKDPQKQAWHDHLTGSYVVKKPGYWFFLIFFLIVACVINLSLLSLNIMRLITNDSLKFDLWTIENLIKEKRAESLETGFDQSALETSPSPSYLEN